MRTTMRYITVMQIFACSINMILLFNWMTGRALAFDVLYPFHVKSHPWKSLLVHSGSQAFIAGNNNNHIVLPFQNRHLLYRSFARRRGDYDENDVNDDDDDDDDEPPDVDVSAFKAPTTSFGLNKGRSSPATRKALGRSGSSSASIHICTNCGSEFVKWMGRCPTCKEWNTLQEHAVIRETTPFSNQKPVFGSAKQRPGSWLDDHNFGGLNGSRNIENLGSTPVRVTDLTKDFDSIGTPKTQSKRRVWIPDDEELNNVLGGGIMRGSLTLIGGDPGVGKSTLMLQAAASVASLSTPQIGIGMGLPSLTDQNDNNNTTRGPVWYVSGEENPEQIASRAARLGISESELYLLRETHIDTLCEQVVTQHLPSANDNIHFSDNDSNTHLPEKYPLSLLVIDSIQTMVCDAGGTSAAGGITQVRECVAMLLRLAKSTGIPVILIGHVTKSGDVAGPRTVEHMVDCVLYLDGSSESGLANLRLLRASKNRFGSADEVGVYEMTSGRLLPVSDPSSLFLAHRNSQEDAEGCAIAISLQGMRAMAVEVQALVTLASGDGKSDFPGRRNVNGIAHSRLLLLMGVLQKRCGVFWSKNDVYVNVVGKIRLDRGEGNAADLAIAVSLASSLYSIPVRSDTAFVGEVGLLGELRSVFSLDKRLNEARRMGFSRIVTPKDNRFRTKGSTDKHQATTYSRVNGIDWIQCETLQCAINEGLVQPMPKRKFATKKRATMDKSPSKLKDLGLDNIIDDDDDDDDDYDSFL